MSFLKVANRAISSLASGISDSDLSLTVATGEGALFPATGDFHLSLDTDALREIVKCTARTGDVLTIVRAQEGTAAAAHASGKAVKLQITAEIIEEIQDAVDARLKVPTGTSWENRTYEGYEIINTPTTYTIGSGQDFETLAECAASLQGLILTDSIFVQLEESITLTETVTFQGMISAGGALFIYLNGYDITINHNGIGIVANGPFTFYVRDNSSAPYNSIIAGANAAGSTYLLRYMNGADGNTYHLNLDANSKAINAMLYVSNDARCYVHSNTVFLDTGAGGLYGNAVEVLYGGYVSASVTLGVAADDLSIASGSMVIDSAGHIHTEAGEYTP